jgi:peptidoglycan/LPS O-acetylase OafA/YrhL
MYVGNQGLRSFHLQAPVKDVSPGFVRPAPGHIPALDGIRGAAAAAVFIYHYGGGARSSNFVLHFIGKTIHLGWAGVSLFFVLSGFLITGILLDSMHLPKWWRTFYLRRTLRIFPLYYAALLGLVLVNLLLRTPWSSIFPIWPFFFYLQDIPHLVRIEVLGPLFTVGHFWSLAVEEQFYLVWPLFLLLAIRRNKIRQLCLGVFLFSLVSRICIFVFHLNSDWAVYFISGRAGEMSAGALLAASLRGSELDRRHVLHRAKLALPASFVGVVTIVLLTGETGATEPWMGSLGIALLSQLFIALIALSLQSGVTQKLFSLPILRWLGKVSYGIYVYHLLLYPVFLWIAHQLHPTPDKTYQVILAAVALVGTLLAATISFATLEKAFLRLKDSLGAPYPVPADDALKPIT